MVVRYPHTIRVQYKLPGSYDNGTGGTGDYTAGLGTTVEIQGRAEKNGKGSLISLQDGGSVVYAYTIYSGRYEGAELPYNAKVEIKEGTTSLWKGTLKGMARHQTGLQLWT